MKMVCSIVCFSHVKAHLERCNYATGNVQRIHLYYNVISLGDQHLLVNRLHSVICFVQLTTCITLYSSSLRCALWCIWNIVWNGAVRDVVLEETLAELWWYVIIPRKYCVTSLYSQHQKQHNEHEPLSYTLFNTYRSW